MAKKSSRDRMSNEINAGSMADIAFLLLIFFLVTTTIVEDKGILVLLPPWSDEEPDVQKMNTRNTLSVLVNAQNQLLVRGEEMKVTELKDYTKEFIMNPTGREDMAERPTKALVSIKNDKSTKYVTYLEVYNELKSAYNELWNDEAKKRYGKDYEFLDSGLQADVRKGIPLVISEAEPTDFGGEE